MKQSTYNAIVSCIKIGAPALCNELVTELNELIEATNKDNDSNSVSEDNK